MEAIPSKAAHGRNELDSMVYGVADSSSKLQVRCGSSIVRDHSGHLHTSGLAALPGSKVEIRLKVERAD